MQIPGGTGSLTTGPGTVHVSLPWGVTIPTEEWRALVAALSATDISPSVGQCVDDRDTS